MIIDSSSIQQPFQGGDCHMSVIESTEQLAPAGTWAADPVHSNVSFEVGYAGVNTFRGSFKEFQAVLAGGAEPTLEGTASVASVDVKDEQLNGHLQTPDFFDADRFPEITFRTSDLETGELTIKGVTQPVKIEATVSEPNVDPFGRERVGIKLAATVDRNEYG